MPIRKPIPGRTHRLMRQDLDPVRFTHPRYFDSNKPLRYYFSGEFLHAPITAAHQMARLSEHLLYMTRRERVRGLIGVDTERDLMTFFNASRRVIEYLVNGRRVSPDRSFPPVKYVRPRVEELYPLMLAAAKHVYGEEWFDKARRGESKVNDG